MTRRIIPAQGRATDALNNPTVSCRLPPDQRKKLEAIALDDDRPISSILRRAVAEWLERMGAAAR